MDALFVLIIIGLYAATRWMIAAVSRLRGVEITVGRHKPSAGANHSV